MSEQLNGVVIELSLEMNKSPGVLLAWLHKHGIDDFVEASCDFLDSAGEEALRSIEAYENGQLNLPVLIYSYDPLWIFELKDRLARAFGHQLRMRERKLPDEIWSKAWEPAFHFLETDHFIIGPEDLQVSISHKILIRLKRGMVFGSGEHATTQGLVRLLEQERAGPAERFLDVGTGTGVLCLVAHFMGYADIWGTDIDPEAIEMALSNQTLNSIPFIALEGSLPPASETFHGIACNILPPTLTNLLPDLVSRLKRGGTLYLAGMSQVNEEALIEVVQALPLEELTSHCERGWIARSYRLLG